MDGFHIPGGRWRVRMDDPSSLSAIRAEALRGLHQKAPTELEEWVEERFERRSPMEMSLA
jgi:hypothetical protein